MPLGIGIKAAMGIWTPGEESLNRQNILQSSLNREPTLSELSEETGLEAEEIAAVQTAMEPVASLQMETGDGMTLESVLGTGGMEEQIVEQVVLRQALRELPQQEQQVLLLRYYKGLTQNNTARIIGVSQVQVSRIERRAVNRLRDLLGE